MNAEGLAETYLRALQDADLPAVPALFTPSAVVHSPLYGSLPPAAFHPAPSGRSAPFDAVDVPELRAARIDALHIGYDTVDVRPVHERATGHRPWRWTDRRPG